MLKGSVYIEMNKKRKIKLNTNQKKANFKGRNLYELND
jgi:hypothetical protein